MVKNMNPTSIFWLSKSDIKSQKNNSYFSILRQYQMLKYDLIGVVVTQDQSQVSLESIGNSYQPAMAW